MKKAYIQITSVSYSGWDKFKSDSYRSFTYNTQGELDDHLKSLHSVSYGDFGLPILEISAKLVSLEDL